MRNLKTTTEKNTNFKVNEIGRPFETQTLVTAPTESTAIFSKHVKYNCRKKDKEQGNGVYLKTCAHCLEF